MLLSILRGGAYDTSPVLGEFTPDDLDLILGNHQVYHDKLTSPAFAPCTYSEGKKKPTHVTAAVLDYDQVPISTLAQCASIPGVYLYSTHGHGLKPGYSFRLVHPFSAPVDAAIWKSDLWPRIVANYPKGADLQCKDPGHIYFLPSCPASRLSRAFARYSPGPALEPLSLPGAPGAPHRLTREDASALATRWKRSTTLAGLAPALRLLVNGEPYASPGERDETTWRLLQAIVQAFPSATPQSLVALFSQSLPLMGSDFDPGIEGKIARIQQIPIAKKTTHRQNRILHAVPMIPAPEPYTAQQLTQWQAEAKCTPEQLTLRWILRCGDAYYFLVDGNYKGPYPRGAAQDAVASLLAPTPFAANLIDDDGQTKPLSVLMGQYGLVIRHVSLDLTTQKAHYDIMTDTLTEAPCPLRPLSPRYHPAVAKWLEILAGPNLSQLLSWIQFVTDLKNPCKMLLLTGKKGSGKSLLALGLARLWTEFGPSPLESAISRFNTCLADCPLVFADETLPKDFHGARTDEIKALISAYSHRFERKGIQEARLIGCVRIIAASNTENVLSLSGKYEKEDIEAIAERILHIQINPLAGDFLRLPSVDTKAFADYAIAEHALWLKENNGAQADGRFLVSAAQEDSALVRRVVTQSPHTAAVCQWITAQLLKPKSLMHGERLEISEGKIRVGAATIAGNWVAHFGDKGTPPSLMAVAMSLRTISEEIKFDGKRRARLVDVENLIDWAETTNFATREEILDKIGRPVDPAQPRSNVVPGPWLPPEVKRKEP